MLAPVEPPIKEQPYSDADGGQAEGPDADGRYFNPFTEPLLSAIMRTAPGFHILERRTTPDRLDRPDLTWQTIILGRCP